MASKRPRGRITDDGRRYAEERGMSLGRVRGLTDSDISGLEVVEDNTERVLAELPLAVARALEKIGLVAEGYAKRLCPVDTGRLRNSITHAIDGDEQAAYIGTNVEYAPYVELGTARQKAQPYLRPAAVDHVEEYRRIIEGELRR